MDGLEENEADWPSAAELCDGLRMHATVRVEAIYGGALVEIVPVAIFARHPIRQNAWEFERRLEHLPGERPDVRHGAVGPACGLQELRDLGATALVMETDRSVNILLTGKDPADASRVLDAAQRFLNPPFERAPTDEN